jgi:hypothetical protein
MTNPGVNDADPVLDDAFPRITGADPSLPDPPEQEELPEEGEQPEPEHIEEP